MASLRKQKNSRYWSALFYDSKGKKIERSTKLIASQKNRKLAQKIADEYEDVARRKVSSKHVRRVMADLHKDITGVEIEGRTLEQYIEIWLNIKKHEVKEGTHNFYKQTFETFKNFLGKEKSHGDINEISKDDILAFRNDLSSTKLAIKTINNKLKNIRMLFKSAKADEVIIDDPCENVSTLKNNNIVSKKRAFTIEELKAVMCVADDEWQSMMIFSLYTGGQRLGDIARLTWHNIDIERDEIRLTTQKTGRPMIIPIIEPLKEHILSLKSTDKIDEPLHPRLNSKLLKHKKVGNLSNEFAMILYQAGLREKPTHKAKARGTGRGGSHIQNELSFHSLRATAVTMLHDLGVPAAIVQNIVGHSSVDVHRKYIKLGTSNIKNALGKLPDLLK